MKWFHNLQICSGIRKAKIKVTEIHRGILRV